MARMMRSRRQRFEVKGTHRVQKVLDYLDLLAQCSNPKTYEYTETDVKAMFMTIRAKLDLVEAAFAQPKMPSKVSFTMPRHSGPTVP